MSLNYVSGFARKAAMVIAVSAVVGLAVASLFPYTSSKDTSSFQYPRDCAIMPGCIDPGTGIMWKVK